MSMRPPGIPGDAVAGDRVAPRTAGYPNVHGQHRVRCTRNLRPDCIQLRLVRLVDQGVDIIRGHVEAAHGQQCRPVGNSARKWPASSPTNAAEKTRTTAAKNAVVRRRARDEQIKRAMLSIRDEFITWGRLLRSPH